MYTNTQQAAGLSQVFTTSRQCVLTTADKAGSDFIALATPAVLLVTMATIIVENDFVKVNTAMPDHPASCGAMKSLLQSAALNSDCLSLGAGHEAEMLAHAYTGVATQTAAAVALQNAEAKTSALRQLSELSDEGLSKLKPTARLSPKRKRALVMVSDSSTALCKMNRRGAFTQSDLDQEVRWAALTLGWSEVRYTMCWGKTLAWLQWQIDEHVKEIRANYPDHVIDIIAWWCGNEISGQWGCIPTRLAPGLGYRDPTVTTEAVAKKVRRSADVLAVLADEPDIGFVKIIGQVEASLFQLHSAYDLFNDAMFAEFRSRGLQVQSATSLVEKLELYDSFHASEDENNRQVFQSYIHNTLNLSKSEWLAEKLAPAVQALLPRYHYQERGEGHNPIVEETFAKWREEKELILNPKVTLKPKHRVVTPEDRLWERPMSQRRRI